MDSQRVLGEIQPLQHPQAIQERGSQRTLATGAHARAAESERGDAAALQRSREMRPAELLAVHGVHNARQCVAVLRGLCRFLAEGKVV